MLSILKKKDKNDPCNPNHYRQFSVRNKTFWEFYLFCEENNYADFDEALKELLKKA